MFQLGDEAPQRPSQGTRFFLRRKTWNDYGLNVSYTLLRWASDQRRWRRIGTVKIISADGTVPPSSFERLDPTFCSLGQSVQYFLRAKLLEIPDLLERLRDVHFNPEFGRNFSNDLLKRTLTRFPIPKRLAAIPFGSSFRVPKKFTTRFRTHLDGFSQPHDVQVSFDGTGPIPRRVAVLIGASGTGKTGILTRLAQAAAGDGPLRVEFQKPLPLFHSVVGIAYGVMQPFAEGSVDPESYIYCGSRELDSFESHDAAVHFDRIVQHLPKNRIGEWAQFWSTFTRAVDERIRESPVWVSERASIFDRLSAGHRMYALMCTSIISRVPNDSLVLVDEPETHLHPELLCKFLDFLLRLLEERNCYALIATHSPLVVQSALARQVLVLRRQGSVPRVETPDRETLGSGLSELTKYVFDYPNIEARPFLSQLESAARSTPRKRLRRLFTEPTSLALELLLEHTRFRREKKS